MLKELKLSLPLTSGEVFKLRSRDHHMRAAILWAWLFFIVFSSLLLNDVLLDNAYAISTLIFASIAASTVLIYILSTRYRELNTFEIEEYNKLCERHGALLEYHKTLKRNPILTELREFKYFDKKQESIELKNKELLRECEALSKLESLRTSTHGNKKNGYLQSRVGF